MIGVISLTEITSITSGPWPLLGATLTSSDDALLLDLWLFVDWWDAIFFFGPCHVSGTDDQGSQEAAREDCQKACSSLLCDYEAVNIPLSQNFYQAVGPSRVWKGPNQDCHRGHSRPKGQYTLLNIPLSPNFQMALWPHWGMITS